MASKVSIVNVLAPSDTPEVEGVVSTSRDDRLPAGCIFIVVEPKGPIIRSV